LPVSIPPPKMVGFEIGSVVAAVNATPFGTWRMSAPQR
jgi:hypothetical protein